MAGMLVGVAAAWSPGIAAAGNITVTNNGDDAPAAVDDGDCTLREAIQAANTNAAVDACPDPGAPGSADSVILGTDTYAIAIAPDGTPDDNEDGDFDTDTGVGGGNLTIQGNGRFNTAVSAAFTDRVFHLLGGAGTATIQGVSVENGLSSGRGGGIFAQAAVLALVSSQVFLSESSVEGGGVAATFNASMTFSDSFIIDNAAHGPLGGGGIFWQPGSSTPTLALQGTVVLNNVASTPILATDMSGGGISSFGKLAMSSGELSGNSTTATAAARGGGIFQNANNGPATFQNSAISGNSAVNSAAAGSAEGGGIYLLNSGTAIGVSLTNSTLSANFVDSPAGGAQRGGGAFGLNPARLRAFNSTISGNLAPDAGGDGGGIHDNGVLLDIYQTTFSENQAADLGDAVNLAATGTDTLKNSVIAEGADACDSAVFTSAGGNVDAGSSCWTISAGADIQNQPAQLGPLALNGGNIVFTHALGLTSPARDRIAVADCVDDLAAPVTEDQRGVARPFPAGGLCDSGSYELIVCNGAPFTPSGPFTGCPALPPPTDPTIPPVTPQTPATPPAKKCKKKKRKRSAAAAKKRCKRKKR